MDKVISAGKNAPKFRRLLVSTAISAAAGMLALGASPAKADNFTDLTVEVGNISVDTSTPNTTNIKQYDYMVKTRGSADVHADWTVNIDQPSRTAKFVVYDTTGTRSDILGDLNANGQIYIFNRNGVIFGPNSTINVGSIIASTGFVDDADIMNNDGHLTFKGVEGPGRIELGGMMNVADAGLAAFVAPTVVNSGIINAKMGKVALAAGDKVTLDLYGDKLVEIAVDGKLADALIENSGAINAEGGVVSMTASAAKEAVDNVINMNGVVNVASATVKGGKIVLSGGDSGVVNVSGTADASGEGGGDIKVTGQNVLIDSDAKLAANGGQNGDGGNVVVIANNAALFRGKIEARGGANGGNGGFVETSGLGYIRLGGTVDTSAFGGLFGTWLIDPLDFVLKLGSGDTSNEGEGTTTGWLSSGGTGANSTTGDISEIYESEIEGQNTNFILRAQRSFSVADGTGDGGTLGDGVIQLKNNKSLTIETRNNSGDGDGTIDLTGSAFGKDLLFKTTGSGNITIKGSTDGNKTSNITLSKLQTEDGDIHVSTKKGTITATRLLKTAGDGNVTLDSGTAGIANNGFALIIDAGGSVTLADNVTTSGGLVDIVSGNDIHTQGVDSGGAAINMSADDITRIDGAVNAGGGTVTLLTDGLTLNGSVAGSAVNIARADDNGRVSLGGSNGGLEISQSELNKITTALLTIGRQGSGSKDDNVMVDSVDFTRFDKVVLNTKRNDSSDDQDVVFRGANKSKALDVHADDDIVFDQYTTCSGFFCFLGIGTFTEHDASLDAQGNVNFYGNTNNLSAGDLRLEDDSTITTNGFSLYAESLNTRLDDGAVIDAEGGNITLKNVNIFSSDDADSVRTSGTGTITLYQNAGGSIQNAVSALNNTGTGQNTVFVGAGTYTENLTLDQANLKLDGATGAVVRAAGAGDLVTVTASNVNIDPITFDGLGIATNGINASGAGASGLVVDGNTFKNFLGAAINVAGGTTTTNIKNNIIFDVAKGVLVSGTSGLTIDSNVIYDTAGNAVDVTGSYNAQIKNNAIGWTSLSGSGSGGTDNIGGDGIRVETSDSADIFGNKVNETAGNGVHVKDSSYVTVGDTSATSITSSSSARNRITNTGLNGILVSGGTENTVQKNVMNNTGNGIMVDGSSFANVLGNRVGFSVSSPNNTVSSSINGDGIVLLNSGDAEVRDNRVNGTTGAGNGIAVNGGVNVDVTANEINSTAAHGIYANGVGNLNITGGNKVGLSGGNDNIKGDGIHVVNSAAAEILGNQVKDAKDDGIYLDPSDDSVIAGNTVTSVGGDGIDSYGNSRVRIGGAGSDRNTINGTGLNGIRVEGGSDNLVQNNAVSNTGANGIYVLNSDDVEVGGSSSGLGNEITGAGAHGIFVSGGEDALIQHNKVTGGDPTLGFFTLNNGVAGAQLDGIHVENNNGADILDNTVAAGQGFSYTFGWPLNLTISANGGNGANGNGIFLSNSDGATIDRNFINPDLAGNGLGAGLDGIHVEDSNLVTVGGLLPLLNGNKIFSTGGDGINIDGSMGAFVLNNWIVGTDIDLLGVTLGGEIGDDGIDLNETVGAVVAGNIITDVDGDGIESSYGLLSAFGLNLISNAGDDGIDVSKSALYLIGGNVINGSGDNGIRISKSLGGLTTLNQIDGSGDDGIEVSDSFFAKIYDNDVTDSGGDGIDVDGGFGISVKKNTVTGTEHNGIEVTDSFGANIVENEVEDAGDDGIHVEDSWFADIEENKVRGSGDDGIQVRRSKFVDVKSNKIFGAGDDGIDVEDSKFADIEGNRIAFVRDNGIEVQGSDFADITGNRVFRTGGHGIYVNPSDHVDIKFNKVKNAGEDGIHVEGGEDIDILFNRIDGSGNNGIDINYADNVLIGWNRITDSEYDGINARWVYGSNRDGYALRVIGNSVDHSGDDGVDINWAGPVLVGWNWITDSGYGFEGGEGSDYGNADRYGADGISVRNVVNNGKYLSEGTDGEGNYYNYAVNIIGNHVHVTGDDGIEVVDSGATVISGNHVRDAGYGDSSGEGEYYDGGDFYGADGIHVRNVHGSESYGQQAGFDGGDGFREYSVVIENNRVNTTGDDGVQVLFSGDTRIAHNTVTDAGHEDGARIYGGDGIHVMNFGSYGYEGEGYNHVEIVDNDVINSLDDGIEVMGTNLEVLVDTNRVDESGDNGIRLLSLGGFFDGPRREVESLVELTGFNSTVTGNTIDNSGTNGLYVAGPGHNDVIVAGNTLTDNPIGMHFESGSIDLTGDTNTINGGDVGMLFRPAIVGYEFPESEGESFYLLAFDPIFAPMSLVGNTIGTTVFNGQSTYFVELDNGAFFAPGNPTILNGMNATYNGVNPSATGGRLTQSQFAMIEAGIFHYVDRQDLGLFFFGFVPNNIDQKDIFRTINGFDAPNGGLNVTITGLPLIPGNLGAFFANIAPAAGEGEEGTDASDLANLEPAAGEGEETHCWSDAVNAALGGATVNFSFGGSAEDLLNGASGCQSGNI